MARCRKGYAQIRNGGSLFTFGGSHLAISAARIGLGIALVDKIEVASDIREGRLIRLFDLTIPGYSNYYLVTVENKFRTNEFFTVRHFQRQA